MQCDSGKRFLTVLVIDIRKTFSHWLFYHPGLFLHVSIKELPKCQYQKFVKYVVLRMIKLKVYKQFSQCGQSFVGIEFKFC